MKRLQITGKTWRWAILAVLAFGAILLPLPGGVTPPVERTYRIEASRFEYTPAVLRANPGDRVTLELVAKDVAHGIMVDGYHLETIAEPGQTARLSFVADQEGSFRLSCTITCGNMHPFMIGKLQVGRNTLFWRAGALLSVVALAGAWLVKR